MKEQTDRFDYQDRKMKGEFVDNEIRVLNAFSVKRASAINIFHLQWQLQYFAFTAVNGRSFFKSASTVPLGEERTNFFRVL